jgi:hypothetical protein
MQRPSDNRVHQHQAIERIPFLPRSFLNAGIGMQPYPPAALCDGRSLVDIRVCAHMTLTGRTHLFDMEVIGRRQNQERCASITCMIRHYVARRAKVIEDHPHNAADRAMTCVIRRCLGRGHDAVLSVQ